MKLEEAIKTAIEYETRVHALYVDAAAKASDDKARRVFETLAQEEQGHLAYLESRLTEWQKTGSIEQVELETVLPSKEVVEAGVARLRSNVDPDQKKRFDAELDMLRQALVVEEETGAFYKRMVKELDQEGRTLFGRFIEIEEGHYAIVQAEIDSVTGMGYWFDTAEFGLETG